MKIDTANEKEKSPSVKKSWSKPELQVLSADATESGTTTPNPESGWSSS